MSGPRIIFLIGMIGALAFLLWLLFGKKAEAAPKEELPPGEAKSKVSFQGYPADIFTNPAGFKTPRCTAGFHPEWHPELEGGSDGGWWCVMDISESLDLLRLG